MTGTDGSIFAVGDCTATSYAPTAQVASQEGAYLARIFKQLAKGDTLKAELEQLKSGVAPEGEQQERKTKLETLESQRRGSITDPALGLNRSVFVIGGMLVALPSTSCATALDPRYEPGVDASLCSR